MNLREARQCNALHQFADEHPISDPDPMGKERFDALLNLMPSGENLSSQETSVPGFSAGSNETRTRRGTSKGASD